MAKKSDLWKLIEAKKSGTRVLSRIQRMLELEVEDDGRRTDVMHPSEMSHDDWCPRRDYYRISGFPMSAENVSFQLQNIFDEGHEIHNKWQMRLWRAGVLGGTFECILCDHLWEGISPNICPECAAERKYLIYREVPLEDDELPIGGHADGALEDGGPPALMEFKSIGLGTVRYENPRMLKSYTTKTEAGRTIIDFDSLWRELRMPFPAHLKQGNMYLRMSGRRKMVYIYESKVHQQVKEFIITYNPEVIAELIDDAKDVKYALDKGVPPDRPSWASTARKTCKTCPFFGPCWDNENGEVNGAKADEKAQPQIGARTRAVPRPQRAGSVGAGTTREAPGDEASGTTGRPRRVIRRRIDEAPEPDYPMGRLFGRPSSHR